jgi:bifunctional non-homologous end joining protein LigD
LAEAHRRFRRPPDGTIERHLTHKQVHEYALQISKRIAARNPRRYTTLAGPSNRIGRLFIDHLRNGRGFTAVGAYSPRAREALPIAWPTRWECLENRLKPPVRGLPRLPSRRSTKGRKGS